MPTTRQQQSPAQGAQGAEAGSTSTRKRLTYAKSAKDNNRGPSKSPQKGKEQTIKDIDATLDTVPKTPQDDQMQKPPQTPSSAGRSARTPSSARKQLISSQNSVPASETDSPTSMVAGTPASKAAKHPTARVAESAFPKQRSALSRGKRTASLISNPANAPDESPAKRSRKKTAATALNKTPVSEKAPNANAPARALSWSAQKKRVQLFKPVPPVSFYGASDEHELKEQLAYMVESDGVLVPSEVQKARTEQELKVQNEIKKIQEGKKRLQALKKNKVSGVGGALRAYHFCYPW